MCASTPPLSGSPARSAATPLAKRALVPSTATCSATELHYPLKSTVMTPPRGMVALATRHRLSSSLTLFLAKSCRVAFQTSDVRSLAMSPRATDFGVAGVDGCPDRARGAEGQPAELQSGGRRMRALLDEFDGDLAHRGVVFVLQHLESVDDGAHRD